VDSGSVFANMNGRAYFGSQCSASGGTDYIQSDYMALDLLGKTFKYTVNLAGATCGCNAALYLTSMSHSAGSTCNDFYCDAAGACDAPCAEIDIQEANIYAWQSTLHTLTDPVGGSAGYGSNNRDWDASTYGPGAHCIDTNQEFTVSASFPVGSMGELERLEVRLDQPGSACPLSLAVEGYRSGGTHGLQELSEALRRGMTPVISYWSAADMLWLDGHGSDSKGPCAEDFPDSCSNTVSFHSFSLDLILGSVLPPAISPPQIVASSDMPPPTGVPSFSLDPTLGSVLPPAIPPRIVASSDMPPPTGTVPDSGPAPAASEEQQGGTDWKWCIGLLTACAALYWASTCGATPSALSTPRLGDRVSVAQDFVLGDAFFLQDRLSEGLVGKVKGISDSGAALIDFQGRLLTSSVPKDRFQYLRVSTGQDDQA